MPKSPVLWAAAALLLLAAPACNTGRRSPAGFRLPPDGDIERGKTAFVELGCTQCHDVAGVNLPTAGARPSAAFLLGGEVTREPGDGRLTAAVIAPGQATRDGWTMPHYEERLTVRQLTDIVAFLQSRYTVKRPVTTLSGY
jgi:mono/diheme cytochrome c family protein